MRGRRRGVRRWAGLATTRLVVAAAFTFVMADVLVPMGAAQVARHSIAALGTPVEEALVGVGCTMVEAEIAAVSLSITTRWVPATLVALVPLAAWHTVASICTLFVATVAALFARYDILIDRIRAKVGVALGRLLITVV